MQNIPSIDIHVYAHYFKRREKNWHKGLSGHVLIIGGELGFAGAPEMAAMAALRVGAGLVSLAVRPENALALSGLVPEVMCHGITTVTELQALLGKANAIVVGPGLGMSAWSQMLWHEVAQRQLPMVVDADALNLLAQSVQVNSQWILTPHPGEAARLLGQTTVAIQQQRLASALAINARYGGVCVLKGAGTLVVAPGEATVKCDLGNPGMATAGMGDVLSGVIAGLLAQGLPLADAARLGVGMHAYAGDLAATSGERGMMATDLMPFLRDIVNVLELKNNE